jgi:ABC-type multidrug transport system ATPase subunit
MTGSVEVNGRVLEENDFAKFAAFVQQDDVLMSTFTPQELFRFAAKLKIDLPDPWIEQIVEGIIQRL